MINIEAYFKMSNSSIMKEFYEFGRKMNTIGILAIVSLIIPFLGIVELIFIFLALGNIKRIIQEMPNQDLSSYRSLYITGFLITFLGILVMVGGTVFLLFTSFYYWSYGFLYTLIGIVIVGFILIFISAIIEYKAWDHLLLFFEQNKQMFPEMVLRDVTKGCKNLKLGALFRLTLILAIVGVILQIIGYFQVSALRNILDMHGRQITPQLQAQTYQPAPQVQQQPVAAPAPSGGRFCPYCGVKIKQEAKFCSSCGSKL